MQDMARPKIPWVVYQEHSSAGRVGHVLIENVFDLDMRWPSFGDYLPETLDKHVGVVVPGGPMSANDHDEFACCETDWLAVPLKGNRLVLGVGLGVQMLVNYLGGRLILYVHLKRWRDEFLIKIFGEPARI